MFKNNYSTLQAIGIGTDSFSRTQVAKQLRERIDKWDYIKLKSFCTTKEGSLSFRGHHRMGENLCQLYIQQGVNNKNIQGTQITKLPKNQ
jgi:hypothetical protein